jgi:Zn-dependent M28 family amino/carboxypeptidase
MKGSYMPSVKSTRRAVSVLVAAATCFAFTSIPATATSSDLPDGPALARNLVRKVTVGNINRHLIALQRFADQTDGTRAAGTEGHRRSAEYIANKLETAGFIVDRQEFPFIYAKTLAQTLSVGGTSVPVIAMLYTASTPVGGLTAPLAVIPAAGDATPGCEATDYTPDASGKVALIQRGGCSFAAKQAAAADAGAVAAIVYNNVAGTVNGTLGDPANARIPSGGITAADGAALIAKAGQATKVEIRAFSEQRTTYNVIAETQTGRHDNIVMAGAHVDSVTAGPGINDDGSGTATLLETAIQLGGAPRVNNAVRFAFWSAEEFGLIGSNFYVNSLDFEDQLDIALYLNFDMIASPNAGYFAFDGDGSDGGAEGPFGSAQIEHAFTDFLGATGTETEGTAFDGRSDYAGFMAAGIPVGGLFTGAEKVKTQAQADKWGGIAGAAYDPCYHQKCDNLGNPDRTVLATNAAAVAWVAATYAISTEDINGIPPGDNAALAKAKSTNAKSRFTATVKPLKAGGTAKLSAADDDHAAA